MKRTKTLAWIAALAMTMSAIPAIPASAAEASDVLHSAEEVPGFLNQIVGELMEPTLFGSAHKMQRALYTVDDPANVPESQLPERFDLRDVDGKNYVTPVRDQSPYGTCWAFAATAAAESSVAYQLGADLNTASEEELAFLDFSERHLAYFANQPLPETSPFPTQAGEGLSCEAAQEYLENTPEDQFDPMTYNELLFNTGGSCAGGTAMYSSYQGPVLESTVPYRGDLENPYVGTCYLIDLQEQPTEVLPKDTESVAQYGTLSSHQYDTIEEGEAFLRDSGVIREDGTIRAVNFNDLDWWEGPGVYVVPNESVNVYQNQTWEVSLENSAGGNWSVSEDLRFTPAVELQKSNILPSPAQTAADGSYQFDARGVNAIKNELIEGRAVCVSIRADGSRPGDPVKKGSFMNFLDSEGNPVDDPALAEYWCHYSFDADYNPADPNSINHTVNINHGVTIVGYDDTIPKEYFRDPNGTIGGDGAFIVKNSWGTNWGSAKTGYFYVSYYDQSLQNPESYSFCIPDANDSEEFTKVASSNQMHDLMPSDLFDELVFDQKTSMANVFTAGVDKVITAVGYTAVTCNENVSVDIYLLNENAKDPTDGTLAAHTEETFRYAGFQRAELDAPVPVMEGQTYSIVVTALREDGFYGAQIKSRTNHDYRVYELDKLTQACDEVDQMLAAAPEDMPAEEHDELVEASEKLHGAVVTIDQGVYGHAVVNPGESLLCVGDTWTDLSDIFAEQKNTEYGKYYDFDNFSIKAFCDSELVNVQNAVVEPQKTYKAGDQVSCKITAKNVIGSMEIANLEILLDGELLETFDTLAGDETKEITYTHTVTEEEAAKGEFTTNVTAYADYMDNHVKLGLLDGLSQTALTVPLTEEAAQPEEPDTKPDEPGTTPDTPAEDFADAEEFAKMSKIDYEKKHGTAVTAETVKNDDGTVTVTLKNADGEVVDTYTLDAKSGIGKNAAGKEVNLPQTGVTSLDTAVAVGGALALTAAGFWMTRKSLRKKEDQ